MSLDRVPLFVWSLLVTSFLVVVALPSIMIASTCLILDRLIGTQFFDPAEGGDVLFWQHLFWVLAIRRFTSSFCLRSAWFPPP
jgi:heme/copper-type cytochrome/quinol oxidase subunit 1